MAESLISFAIQRLGDLLIKEIVFQKNVRTEILWLKNELGYMCSFIKDAEEKQESDHRVRQWISEVTDIANDTMSILEELTFKIEVDGGASKPGCLDRLRVCACICGKEAQLYGIGKEIDTLKKRVLDLSRKRETYGIKNIGHAGGEGPSSCQHNTSMIKALRRATSFADNQQIFVGVEDVTERLLNELLKDEPCRSVVSILGMGGLGKTTVARHLYHSSAVVHNFPNRAWVSVSQDYSIADLLRTIIKSFKKQLNKEDFEMIEKMNEEDLERHLRVTLENKRYLIVVDDVWHKEAWQSLKRGFPDCKNGSRVIITTRKKDVATRTDEKCFVHELRFLNPEESWDLFCKKLSCSDDYADWCSVRMLDLGREMVEKCSGLPLAIIVLGGMLSHKKRLSEWQLVKEHLWRQMKDDSLEISHLLSLSYKDLSSELKPCFLYIALFPEDYLIETKKLMWLWMAEGFIEAGERMEDIAEDYLNELIDRNLIQVASQFLGRIHECRIHDLLRDLAVEKAKSRVFDIYGPPIHSAQPSSSRHAIHTQAEKYLSPGHSNRNLLSLLILDQDCRRSCPTTGKIFFADLRFRYLSVLELETVRLTSIHESIGNLILLRYLGLSVQLGETLKLPESIVNLRRLQILSAYSHSGLRRAYSHSGLSRIILPAEIYKLTNLRHLSCDLAGGGLDYDLDLGSLTNLRTLGIVPYFVWMRTDATNLMHLRELKITGISPLEWTYSLESVAKLKSLRALVLWCSHPGGFPSLEPLSSCQYLTRLWLQGKIENLSSLKELPQSITVLRLSDSKLKEDPMPVLQTFPNLWSLELDGCKPGRKIVCGAKGFPQLRLLRLHNMHDLETWELEEGALPVIRGLSIIECPNLKFIPERLKYVPVLKD